MSRLEQFRAAVAALDPTASPRTSLDAGHCVDPPSDVAVTLARRLALSPASTTLVLGHVGGGKTTTMLRARRLLKEEVQDAGDRVRFVDVSAKHRLDDAKLEGVLAAVAGKALQPELPKGDVDETLRAAWQLVHRHADTFTEWDEYPAPDDDDHELYPARNKGVLVPPVAPFEGDGLTAALRTLRGHGHATIFFDSLDRLRDPTRFRNAVEHDLRVLREAGIGSVIAGPIRYALGTDRSVRDLFEHVVTVPAPDPDTVPGLAFLVDVLRARSATGLFDDEARTLVARASGGVLRNLVGLARSAAEEAYASGADSVNAGHVAAATSALGDDLTFGIDSDQMKILRRTIKGQRFAISGENELALVDSGRILFREAGRFVVHPALVARLTGTELAA